ncbi:MAG: tRNA pseudouridine(55) synthase TruB [Chlamydiae bacterium RIFCSPHIGHO2_12_FULL_27_8]|nr:MAG: tRNA pseudouridine(55) synthase TruB [Chlamydiae bacterium RIFCSPHIGHO2_12_FULL_27_8]
MNNIEGILLVNKSINKTSFSLVAALKKLTNTKKIGHAGTLDPLATGLMILLLGKNYTKKSDRFITFKKEYEAVIELGYTTETFDSEKEKIFVSDKIPKISEIEEILKKFSGNIKQIPPMYSAKKINGKKLYELARKGIEVERKEIDIFVEIHIIKYEYPFLHIDVRCSKGTYIRSLANDIGKELGTGGYLYSLIRTKCGPYNLSDAVDQELLQSENFDIKKHIKS